MFYVGPASLAPAPASAGTDAARDPPSPARALIERRIAALSRLADMGMDIAGAATRAATTAPAPDAPADHGFTGDPVLAYTRAARAVRQSFALQSRLLDELTALEKAEGKQAYDRKVRRRQGAHRLVEAALDAERPEAEAWEFKQLSNVCYERLRDAEDEEDQLGRPFAELVARICADLGLSAASTAQVVAFASGSPPDPSGGFDPRTGSWAEGREGGEGAITAGRSAPAAPSTVFDGPPPPRCGGGSGEDTFLEWPPPAPA